MFRKNTKEKALKMIWEVEKKKRKSFLVGTAHFFPYSFKTTLSGIMKDAHTVLFEGPLDEENMAKVIHAGYEKEKNVPLLKDLDRQTISEITKVLIPIYRRGDPFFFFNFRTLSSEDPLYNMIKGMKPWMAFFTLWGNFLRMKGWLNSVDMEAYTIAREMGKHTVFLETIEEQIEVLESLSYEKIINFLKRAKRWDDYSQRYVHYYLEGEVGILKSNSIGFPSRHHTVIDRRDQIFYERMQVYLEEGNVVVCVGAPHVPGINEMLRVDGYGIKGPQGAG